MSATEANGNDIKKVLELDRPARPWRRRVVVILILLAAAAAGAWFWNASGNASTQVQYQTAPVETGDLVVTVTATGTLEPVNQVDVGTELSGTIKSIEVDFNDRVQTDQVLARLDTSKLDAQLLQEQAALAVAQAQLLDSQAEASEARINYNRLKQAYELSGGRLPSRQDLDAAEATHKKAQAQVEVSRAGIAQAQASLDATQSDLSKSVIRAPLTGIVLDRQVEVGQTVAASYSTPVLFTLAEDLTHMSLYVDVDEADVGEVREGQSAVFTVDAYPDRKFPGVITQVRFTPQEDDSGVVTYQCLLSVDNSDLLLRPGMTATADITVKEVKGGILVPNTALRFTPPQPENQASASTDQRSLISKIMPGPPFRQRNDSSSDGPAGKESVKRVWVMEGGRPAPVEVTTGATDGIHTEITGGDLKAGQSLALATLRTKQ